MPTVAELPASLQDLPRLNGVSVRSGADFDGDAKGLIEVINKFGYKRLVGTVSKGFFLRADANRDSKIIGRVIKESAVTLLEYNRDGTWCHLWIGENVDGWAATEDFTLITQQPTYPVKEIHVDKGFGAKGGSWQLYFTAPTGDKSWDGTLGIEVRLADAISRCRSSLDIAAFEFNNEVLTEEILDAWQRGIQVRIVTHSERFREEELKAYTFGRFIEAGIPVIASPRAALMHNSFMILDGKTVWTGSWSYTKNATYQNNGNTLVFDVPDIAAIYKGKFDDMFLKGNFGYQASVNEYYKVLVSGVLVEIWFTPSNNIEMQIQELIQRAENSIHFMMFSFVNSRLGDAMVSAFQRGVRVFGIQENVGSTIGESVFGKLVNAGLDVRPDTNPFFLNHKVMVVDASIVLTGSCNFSPSAFENNDENLLIIHDPGLAKVYIQEFERLWANTKISKA